MAAFGCPPRLARSTHLAPPPRQWASKLAQLIVQRNMGMVERLHYNRERVHTSLGDAPEGRGVEGQPSQRAKVIGLPRVGGLHHRYAWAEAAG
jgi:hypothetical protein